MKKVLPITLILLGTLLLSGCLFVPAFNRVDSGVNVADKVGSAKSNRPLRVDIATMTQVLALLGPPHYASDDGRRIAYTWQVINGYWFMPLCFATQTQRGARGIQLIFDSNGILRQYQIRKIDGSIDLWSAPILNMGELFPELHPVPLYFRFGSTQPTTQQDK